MNSPGSLPDPSTASIPPVSRAWHARHVAGTVAELHTDEVRGLSEAESRLRRANEGANVLPEAEGPRVWTLFLDQFKSLVIGLLIVAGAVSAVLGEAVDAIAILTIVFLNAVVGFYQEYSAGKSIGALRKLTAPSAKVRRDGNARTIPASEVVRGDLIEFESGDLIPADARLVAADELKCVESALTGESEASAKNPDPLPAESLPIGDRANMVFMGTSVAAGSGKAIVVETGPATEIGRIAGLLEVSGEEATPLQKRLDSLGRYLVWIAVALVATMFLLGMLRGMEPFQLFLTSISLAVAAAPEGLPAVVTVALALGVRRMSKRNALVRRLASVETLGSATVICTDKTGTLTAGEMTVRELYCAGESFRVDGSGLDPAGAVHGADGPPDAAQAERLRHLARIQVATLTAELYQEQGRWKVSGDPTEGALITSARKLGLDTEGERTAGAFAYPFDSDRKRASVVRREKDGGFRALVNGAPDVLLGLCTRFGSLSGIRPLDEKERARILEANAAMAGRGLRVLGSAFREWIPQGNGKPPGDEVERDLVFAGLAGMYDPPRPEARAAVAKCRAAGIRVVMITGDHPATAQAIGKDLGILDGTMGVLTGVEMAALDEAGLEARVEGTGIYARVSAEHKLRIVKAWRRRGAVVAMTGDGVNDAPALKGAHIGVAMGRAGTEVTKQASDIVIVDDNFASIVAAVEQGRGIYQNIRNTLQFLLGGNVGELLLMMVAILAGFPAPLLAVHLLWINLVTDGLPALCLAAERIDPEVMGRKPRIQSEIMSDPRFRNTLLLTGFLTAAVSLAVFVRARDSHSLEEARSYAFATLVFAELFRSFGARSEFKPIWKMDPRGNFGLPAVVAVSMALQVLVHQSPVFNGVLKTSPLSAWGWAALLTVSTVPMVILELLKILPPPFSRKPA
ncbi:MAG TPA: cation-translocating P-type ATPase [Fibrobacteria bacterium]|nr:cation-translocating P-type ATPase [Fibrobacteria bacterium]